MASLTEMTCRSAKPPEAGQKTFWDDLPGFGLRVSQGGTKTFVLVHGKARKRVSIGRYPIISLALARDKAKTILAEHQLNGPKAMSLTFDEALKLFLAVHCKQQNKASTAAETQRLLTRHFLLTLKEERLAVLAIGDFMEIV